jgi:hypothetical protein
MTSDLKYSEGAEKQDKVNMFENCNNVISYPI